MLTVTDSTSLEPGGHSLQVTRSEKEATVKFNVSAYIGKKVTITAIVKTDDAFITMGFDGVPDGKLITKPALKDDWTYVSVNTELSSELKSAEIYLETDGNADFYVDDFMVSID